MSVGIGTPSVLRTLLGGRDTGEEGDEASSSFQQGSLHRVASYEQTHVLDGGEGVVSKLVSTYNLTSTILGAGVLSIPYAIAECGLVTGILLLAFTAVASSLSCNLVLSSYLRTGRGSYGDLARLLFGLKFATLIKWIIIVLNIGAAAGYILVIRSLLPPSLCQLSGKGSLFCGDEYKKSVITGVVVFGIVFPLCTLKNLSSLRHTSILAFFFAVFLTVAISIRSLQHSDQFCPVQLFPKSIMGLFKAVPVFCFSFVCHLNVLPVYDQLHSRSPTKMRSVFRNAILFAMTLYCFAGGLGYLRFNCGKVPDNILDFGDGYFPSNDMLIAVARVAEALTCTLALPLIQHPTRVALDSFLFRSVVDEENSSRQPPNAQFSRSNGSQVDNGYDFFPIDDNDVNDIRSDDVGNSEVVRLVDPVLRESWATSVRAMEAFTITLTAFVLALVVPNISTVFGLLGSTCCSLVCFILPGTFYLECTRNILSEFPWDRPYSTKDRDALVRVVSQRRMSWVMITFGVLVAVLGTVATLN